MPLIDVVFLLLTFFIYAMVVMVELKTSGLSLASVEGGQQSSADRVILVVLDRAGRVQIDGVVVADDELDERLAAIAADPTAPPLVVTMEAGQGEVDRGPLHQQLLHRIQRAGVRNMSMPADLYMPGER